MRTLAALRKALRPEDGSVSILTAASMTMLAGFAAVVIDAGLLYLTQRNLQAATDVAALVAAKNLDDASIAATAQFTGNGFPAAAMRSATLGTWDTERPVAARFTAGNTGADAVRFDGEATVPLFFGRLLTGTANAQVWARATATHVPLGSFSIGSGILNVDTANAAYLNTLLGSYLGTTLNLSAVAWTGLTGAHVDALRFLDMLASEAGVTAGTYDTLADATVTMNGILRAVASVLGDPTASTGGATAQPTIQALIPTLFPDRTIKVGDLLELGFWREQKIGSSSNSGTLRGVAALNVLDIISTASQVGGASTLVTWPTTISLLGASVSAKLALIEPMKTVLGRVAPTTRAEAAQVRLSIEVTITDLALLRAVPIVGPLLGAALIRIPIYVDLAPATGELVAASCGDNPATDATMTVRVTTGIARAAIGSVTPAALTGSGAVSLPSGDSTIINLIGLIQVGLQAGTQIGAGGPTDKVFNATQIAGHETQRVTSTSPLATMANGLTTANLTVTLAGAARLANTGLVATAVLNTIKPVLVALDPVINEIVKGLGIQLGYADVRPLGVRCGVPLLVN